MNNRYLALVALLTHIETIDLKLQIMRPKNDDEISSYLLSREIAWTDIVLMDPPVHELDSAFHIARRKARVDLGIETPIMLN